MRNIRFVGIMWFCLIAAILVAQQCQIRDLKKIVANHIDIQRRGLDTQVMEITSSLHRQGVIQAEVKDLDLLGYMYIDDGDRLNQLRRDIDLIVNYLDLKFKDIKTNDRVIKKKSEF